MVAWIIKTRRGKLDVQHAGLVWSRFAHYTKPHWAILLSALLASLGAVGMQIASPWPIKVIFDCVLPIRSVAATDSWLARWCAERMSDPTSLLAWVCAAVLVIAVFEALFSHFRDVALAQVGHQVVGSIRRDLFAHVQSLPPSAFEHRRTGDLLMRLTGDIQMLRQMLVDSIITMAQSGVTVAAMVLAMIWLNPTLAFLGLLTIPVTVWMGWRVSRQIRKATKDQREKESHVANIAHDVLGAMAIIQAFNRQPAEQKRFSRQNRSSVRAGLKTTRLQSKLNRVIAVASATAMCLILFVGVRSVLQGVMTAGDLLVFISYLRGLNKPLRNFAQIVTQTAKATSCGDRVGEIFDLRPGIRNREGAITLANASGRVAFEGVSFGYVDGVKALNNVSMLIEPGRRVAIVGATGAGKSTLAKLLLRFYDPHEGRVTLDSVDLRDATLESIRRQIGWVHQDTILFGMTVAENIALGCGEASQESIRQVARRVGAHEFITKLPHGYATVLGQSGSTLSGGQRQRLALARALLPAPPILLLDEPATGLDAVSRQLVQEVWLSAENKATTLVICHRLRDMERFDQILVLREGEIEERGTHAELLMQVGEYAALHGAGVGVSSPDVSTGRLAC